MATKSIAWQTGSGNITLTYQGYGDGTISVQSDENNGSARSQVITVQTLEESGFDTEPIQGSMHPATSDGIYTALTKSRTT